MDADVISSEVSLTNETFVVTNIVYPVMIPFLSAGRTGDQVTLIDVELRVVDDKLCGNPEGTKKNKMNKSLHQKMNFLKWNDTLKWL